MSLSSGVSGIDKSQNESSESLSITKRTESQASVIGGSGAQATRLAGTGAKFNEGGILQDIGFKKNIGGKYNIRITDQGAIAEAARIATQSIEQTRELVAATIAASDKSQERAQVTVSSFTPAQPQKITREAFWLAAALVGLFIWKGSK